MANDLTKKLRDASYCEMLNHRPVTANLLVAGAIEIERLIATSTSPPMPKLVECSVCKEWSAGIKSWCLHCHGNQYTHESVKALIAWRKEQGDG